MDFLGSPNTSSAVLVAPVLNCKNSTIIANMFAAATVVDILLSLPSNSWVAWMLLKAKNGFFPSDLFTFNLAFNELLICPLIVINTLYSYQFNMLSRPGVFFSNIFFRVGRPIFQCCICLERYLAVVHPITFLKYKVLKYKLGFLGLTWLLILGLGVQRAYKHSNLVVISVFAIVLTIESFCSFSILRVLRQPRPGDREKEEMNLMKRRAFTTILVFQMIMLVNYLPYILVQPLNELISIESYCYLHALSVFFSVSCGFVHAFLFISRAMKIPCTKQSK